jgi:hypothetical protein
MPGRIGRFGAAAAMVAVSALLVVTAGLQGAVPAGASSVGARGLTARRGSGGSPTVSGPVTGGLGAPVLFPVSFDLSQVGYEESEFFVSGTASSYSPVGTLGADGVWKVEPASTAPYTTRIVVRRPVNPRHFNGTVVVEWLNVSGGVDADPDWTESHNELIRDGFAWVGVSAQAVGVNALKTEDAVRYAPLSHPGDSFSYDMYTQAGEVIRSDARQVLSGLHPHRVLAAGESQSAARLVTYIDALAKTVRKIYDGYLVHSRFSGGAPLSQSPQTSVSPPSPLAIRSDLRTPVFVFETETDVSGSNLADRQPNTRKFRLWEVAGTSHYDWYGLVIGPNDIGDGQGAVQDLQAMQDPPTVIPPGFSCNLPINTGGAHWALDAAMYWLNRWVAHGTPPPIAPLLQVTSSSPVVFAEDANGNVLGGVRTPMVDAPVAALGGTGNGGTGPIGSFCGLFGTTVPLTPSQIAALYPTHDAFVDAWRVATADEAAQGYLLHADAHELAKAAADSSVGG